MKILYLILITALTIYLLLTLLSIGAPMTNRLKSNALSTLTAALSASVALNWLLFLTSR